MSKVLKVIRWADPKEDCYIYRLEGVEPTITMTGTCYNYEPKMDLRNIQGLLNHAHVDWDKNVCFALMHQMERK